MRHNQKTISKVLKATLLVGSISLFLDQVYAIDPEPPTPPTGLIDSSNKGFGVLWGISPLEGDWVKMLYLGAPTKDGTAEKCAFPVVLTDSEEACTHYNCINSIFLNRKPVEKLTAYGQRGIFVVNCNGKKRIGQKPDLLLDDNGKRLETFIFIFYPNMSSEGFWEQGKKGKNYSIELYTESDESRLVYEKGQYRWEKEGMP